MTQVHKCQWVVLQVILNIMCGSGMEVPMDSVPGDSEHYVWLTNGGAIKYCYKK